jgi:hypothetical protein
MERELHRHQVQKLRPFERWSIDLVGILPKTPHGNRWIITAVDFATGWPVAKALPDAKATTIAAFLYDLCCMYGVPREILTDLGANFVGKVMEHYLTKLGVAHATTTPYHPRTNGKVENFNGLIGRTLTKLLLGKPVRLWDEYLGSALFACRIRLHATSKFSPYYLVFGEEPRLPTDGGIPRDPNVETDEDETLERIRNLATARTQAYEELLIKAEKAAKTRNEQLRGEGHLKKDDWVLIRNEAKQKFESSWFGPYKILSEHMLGTYRLEEPGPKQRILKNLIHGNRLRLIPSELEPDKLWTDAKQLNRFRKAAKVQANDPEVELALDQEDEIPSYGDLSTISRKEYEALLQARHRKEINDRHDDFAAQEAAEVRRSELIQEDITRRRSEYKELVNHPRSRLEGLPDFAGNETKKPLASNEQPPLNDSWRYRNPSDAGTRSRARSKGSSEGFGSSGRNSHERTPVSISSEQPPQQRPRRDRNLSADPTEPSREGPRRKENFSAPERRSPFSTPIQNEIRENQDDLLVRRSEQGKAGEEEALKLNPQSPTASTDSTKAERTRSAHQQKPDEASYNANGSQPGGPEPPTLPNHAERERNRSHYDLRRRPKVKRHVE